MDGTSHDNGDAPRIVLEPGVPPSQAVAVVAAVQAFLAETAPAAANGQPTANAWQRTALAEGIAARQISGYGWGSVTLR